jgi:hypothetical protein
MSNSYYDTISFHKDLTSEVQGMSEYCLKYPLLSAPLVFF